MAARASGVTDPWNVWDERVLACGRPDRVVAELSNPELLALLAEERQGTREVEKRIVRQELLVRLESGHRSEGPVQAFPSRVG